MTDITPDPVTEPQYYLTVAAICKNEAPYIEEWIEWHLLHGVEHFYITDNGSTDGTWDILMRYSQLGFVTLTLDHEEPIQFKAYNKTLEQFGADSTWMAFIDIDEFLYPEINSDIPTTLLVFEGNYPDTSIIAPHWVFYGDNFKVFNESDLVTPVVGRFLMRAKVADKHVKSVVKPSKILKVGNNPHTFRVKEGTIRNTVGTLLPTEYAYDDKTATLEILRINHYHTKTKHEYEKRKLNNDSGSGRPYTSEMINESFNAHNINEQWDEVPARHSSFIKRMIKRTRLCQKQ